MYTARTISGLTHVLICTEIIMVCFPWTFSASIDSRLVQVRLQGDMAKPVDKRLNYKHCFDGLFRASFTPVASVISLTTPVDGARGGFLFPWSRNRSQRGPRCPDERKPTGFVCFLTISPLSYLTPLTDMTSSSESC